MTFKQADRGSFWAVFFAATGSLGIIIGGILFVTTLIDMELTISAGGARLLSAFLIIIAVSLMHFCIGHSIYLDFMKLEPLANLPDVYLSHDETAHKLLNVQIMGELPRGRFQYKRLLVVIEKKACILHLDQNLTKAGSNCLEGCDIGPLSNLPVYKFEKLHSSPEISGEFIHWNIEPPAKHDSAYASAK